MYEPFVINFFTGLPYVQGEIFEEYEAENTWSMVTLERLDALF